MRLFPLTQEYIKIGRLYRSCLNKLRQVQDKEINSDLSALILYHNLYEYGYTRVFTAQGFFSKVTFSCEHGRLRRPERFFVVLALFALPAARQKAPTRQKRSVQRQSLCTTATFEKP
jgi:hypothetical protein